MLKKELKIEIMELGASDTYNRDRLEEYAEEFIETQYPELEGDEFSEAVEAYLQGFYK